LAYINKVNLIKMRISSLFVYAENLISHWVSLATIEVHIFCAVTSVAALFILSERGENV